MLANLGVRSVGDLLFHFPRSFDDLSNVIAIDAINAGEMQTVIGEVVELDSKELPDGLCIMSVVIADAKGRVIEGTWFNVVPRQFRYGQRSSPSAASRNGIATTGRCSTRASRLWSKRTLVRGRT